MPRPRKPRIQTEPMPQPAPMMPPPPSGPLPEGKRFMLPNPDDPETGEIVRGVPMDPGPEDYEPEPEPEPDTRRRTPTEINPKGGPVSVYIQTGGGYRYLDDYPERPTDHFLRTLYPNGGKFRLEQKDAHDRVTAREHRDVAGFAFGGPGQPAAGPPAGWGNRYRPPEPPGGYNGPPQAAPPAPTAPGIDWPRIIAAGAPIVTALLTSVPAMISRSVADAVRAALPNAGAPPPPPADPFAQLRGMGEALRALQEVGLISIGGKGGGEDPEADQFGGFASVVTRILESQQRQAPPALGLPPGFAPPGAPAAPAAGPTEEQAHAECVRIAGKFGLPLEQAREFLLRTYLQKDSATWGELAQAAHEYAAQQGIAL